MERPYWETSTSGRTHEHGLVSRFRPDQSKGGDHGFASAHIAQQQMVHRIRCCHARKDVSHRCILVSGQGKGQAALNLLYFGFRESLRKRRMLGGSTALSLDQFQFQEEQFLVAQTALGLMAIFHGKGLMNPAKCLKTGIEPIFAAQRQRKRIVCTLHLGKRVANNPLHHGAGNLSRSRMNGQHHALHLSPDSCFSISGLVMRLKP